jgi:hypothetical protein
MPDAVPLGLFSRGSAPAHMAGAAGERKTPAPIHAQAAPVTRRRRVSSHPHPGTQSL